eukprot:scaffold19617_cov127-Isochrysis_galbana.AAC.4
MSAGLGSQPSRAQSGYVRGAAFNSCATCATSSPGSSSAMKAAEKANIEPWLTSTCSTPCLRCGARTAYCSATAARSVGRPELAMYLV